MKEKKPNYIIDDSLAYKFARYMQKYQYLYRYLATKTKNHLPNTIKKPIIVDLSVGPGLLSLELNRDLDNADIIGLDPSKNMLKIAKDKLSKCNQCNLVMSRVENLPIKRCYADIVVSRFGVSSWENLNKGFSEVYRVLKPKGKIVLEILNKDLPKSKQFIMKTHMMIKGAGKELIKYNFDSYKNVIDIKQIEELLIDVGFKIIEREGRHNDWKILIVASRG